MKFPLLAIVLLFAAILLAFHPYILRGKTFLPVDEYNMLYKPYSSAHTTFNPYNHFEDDILKWYYEWKTYSKKYLYKPYWSPNAFGGIPWYADTYASHFCTTNWILKLGPVEKTYPIQLMVQLFIAGLGMFLLLQGGLAISLDVSLLYSISFMLSSMFITTMLRWWIIGAFSWVPYLFLATIKFWESGRTRYFALASLFLAFSFMDGFLQSNATVIVLYAAFVLSWWHWVEKRLRFWQVLLFTSLIYLFAFFLSSIMWLPMLEYFLQDIAKGSTRASGNVFGKSLVQRVLTIPFLLSFMMPQILGGVRALDFAKLINSHLQDFTAYIGSAPLLFGISAAFDYGKLQKHAKPFLALVLFGLIVPIATPLDRFFYFRFLVVYITGICVLGAFGLENFLKNNSKTINRTQKIYFGVYALIFLGICGINSILFWQGNWIKEQAEKHIRANFNLSTIGSRNHDWMLARVGKTIEHFSLSSPTMYLPLLTVAIVFFSLYFYRKSYFNRKFLTLIFFATTLTELIFFARLWLPINDTKQYPLYGKNTVTDFLLEHSEHFRSTVNDANGSNLNKQKQILPTNSQIIYGYKTLEGFDGLVPKVIYYIPAPLDDYKKLGLLNVKYILTNPEPLLTDPALTLVQSGAISVYENKLAKSRARIVYRNEIIPSANTILEKMAQNSYDGNVVYFETPPPKMLSQNIAFTETEIVDEGDNHISYRMNAVSPAYFVASESYYPGWKAWLDGKPVDILKANYAMRAVLISEGKHTLEFKFEPPIYTIGLYISLVFFLLFLLLFFWPQRKLNFSDNF